ncbi:hypothetical protein ACL2XO_20875 [Sodalis sp. RH15]
MARVLAGDALRVESQYTPGIGPLRSQQIFNVTQRRQQPVYHL